jgi:hypothetical protein
MCLTQPPSLETNPSRNGQRHLPIPGLAGAGAITFSGPKSPGARIELAVD